MIIDGKTRETLSGVRLEGNLAFLPERLARKDYEVVDQVLQSLGGRWNRARKAHIFEGDPTEALDRVFLTGEVVTAREKLKEFGFFCTPPGLCRYLAGLARLEPDFLVLEPSAGTGALAEVAAAVVGKNLVTCVEIQAENAAVLAKKGFYVLQEDFLSLPPVPDWDVVLMNPPFRLLGDIDHVLHARACLKPGGRLVSVMSAGVVFRQEKKACAFRELLEHSGTLEKNPAGSFSVSGTEVATVTVVLRGGS
jgi:SAM-dependent methyltransferase